MGSVDADAAAASRATVPAIEHRALLSCGLFEGLTPAQMHAISTTWEERRYEPGEHVLWEGEPDAFVYVLLEGRAALVKEGSLGAPPSPIGEVRAGDTVGEVKLVHRQPSTASVVAVTPVTAVAIDLDVFERADALAEARAVVWRNVGRILVERLRRTSVVGADAIQRELRESEARAYAGRFVVLMFAMVAGFELVLAGLGLVPAARRPSSAVLIPAFVLWTAAPMVILLRRAPFPLASYGLTFRNGWAHARQALALTTPLLALILLLKLWLVHGVPSMAGRALFEAGSVADGPGDGLRLVLAALLYGVHAPLQEFVRAGFQGSLQHFLRVPGGRVSWTAVVVSNLVFASFHAFLGFWYSVASFVPGIFWGWLLARQRSLVGVSVSHAAVGWWALFALGLGAILGND
jgi:CRP-like cAMP-binding protein